MRPLPSLVLACLLALAAPAAAVPDPPGAEPRTPPGRDTGFDTGRGTGGGHRPQTSDGVVGPVAADVPASLRGYRATSARTTSRVAPGVSVTTWKERDVRGPARFSLLTLKWRTPGLSVDYANAGAVPATASVSSILARDGAVAGVNGDFFDIGDTGAPLGIGLDRQRGLLHGPLSGWNSALSIARGGRPEIGPLTVGTGIRQRPRVVVTNLNSPTVAPNGIGLYTRDWGGTSGYRITDGRRHQVRRVQVVGGRVVRNTRRLPRGTPVNGRLLIGRGQGAQQLAGLRPGQRLSLKSVLQSRPQMAITGNRFLLRDGVIEVVDDSELHPRTAVGIDRDTESLLFLVVDGRRASSRGYTMVELAEKMVELGAEDALNLDGGGSSTLVARRPGSRAGLGVVNIPSDGAQRAVPNALAIHYRRPR